MGACGDEGVVVCPCCGRKIEADHNFCLACGYSCRDNSPCNPE